MTYEDVFSILPFNNTIDRITMTGGEILETLEEAISDLCANMTCNPEEFLQVSGIKMKAIVRDDNSGNRIAGHQECARAVRILLFELVCT